MQFNEIFIRYWFFFFNLWKKNLNRSTEGRPTIQFGRRAKPVARRWEGWAKPKGEPTSQRRAPQQQSESTNSGFETKNEPHDKRNQRSANQAPRERRPALAREGHEDSTGKSEQRPREPRAQRNQRTESQAKNGRAAAVAPEGAKTEGTRNQQRSARGGKTRRKKKKKGGKKTRLTHSQGFGFSRLACRERSERNAKREKTYIIFAGGTDAKIIKSISEVNTACSLFY